MRRRSLIRSASALWEKIPSGSKTKVRRDLGVLTVSAYLVGGMIGTGIFISPMGVIANTGSPGLAICVWLGCGIVAMLAALCFAELGTTFPHSGSSYIYIKLAFGDFPAFLFEWVDVILRKSTTLAVRYLTFAVYVLQPLYPHCSPPPRHTQLVAAIAILALSFVNGKGVKWRSFFQILTTATKLGALLMIFFLAIHSVMIGKQNHLRNPFEGEEMSVGRIALAFSYGLYAYSGWDTMNAAVEEIKSPNRVLPLAIFLSVALVTVAYLLVNLAYFIVLPPDQIIESDAVAVVFARKIFPAGAWTMSILVGISAIGACNAAVFQVSRYYFAIAREGQMPRFLATIHPENNSPLPAILLVTILSLVCLMSGDISQLLAYYGFLKWSMVALPVAAQIRLRFKYPDTHRPLKLPLALPILTLTIMVSLLVVPIYENWWNSLVALLLSLLSLPIYAFFFAWTTKPPLLQAFLSSSDRILTEIAQKCLLVEVADRIGTSTSGSLLISRENGSRTSSIPNPIRGEGESESLNSICSNNPIISQTQNGRRVRFS